MPSHTQGSKWEGNAKQLNLCVIPQQYEATEGAGIKINSAVQSLDLD